MRSTDLSGYNDDTEKEALHFSAQLDEMIGSTVGPVWLEAVVTVPVNILHHSKSNRGTHLFNVKRLSDA